MHQGCEVWAARLSELRPHESSLAAVLTPAERADRAGHADASTGALSRAVLRLVLARHLGVMPEQLDIDRRCPTCGRPHGRPRLRTDAGAPEPSPQVSVSHGGDLLVVALADRGPVGVDVEPARPSSAVEADLLELTLTPAERSHLASVPADQQHLLFLHYWTGKEAVLKALGTGLDLPLQAVALPAPSTGGTTAVAVPGAAAVELTVQHLDLGPAHVGALATAGPVGPVPVGWLSAAALLDALRS